MYVTAIEEAFGADIDYSMIVKFCAVTEEEEEVAYLTILLLC